MSVQAQIVENEPKWVENRPFGPKQRPYESYGASGPILTTPEAKHGQKFDFLTVLDFRSGPDGSGQAVGFIWSLFRAKRSILDPFRAKFDVFGRDRNCGQRGLDLG